MCADTNSHMSSGMQIYMQGKGIQWVPDAALDAYKWLWLGKYVEITMWIDTIWGQLEDPEQFVMGTQDRQQVLQRHFKAMDLIAESRKINIADHALANPFSGGDLGMGAFIDTWWLRTMDRTTSTSPILSLRHCQLTNLTEHVIL